MCLLRAAFILSTSEDEPSFDFVEDSCILSKIR